MATVYSLICFGGRTGKTVTLSIASPCVASLTNHGLRDGLGVSFSTTGALPSGITAGTTYYAKSIDTDTVNLYDTAAHAIAGGATGRVNTSGSQSGTHTVKSTNLISLGSLSRWGSSGSERIYDGLNSFVSARSSANNGFDSEVCEVLDPFIDYITNSFSINMLSAPNTLITSMVNGVRSAAFPGGKVDAGYTITSEGYFLVQLNNFTHLDGLSFRPKSTANSDPLITIDGTASSVKNCVLYGWSNAQQTGLRVAAGAVNCQVLNNLVVNFQYGIFNQGATVCLVANNIVAKCAVGIYTNSTSYRYGIWYNNISVGNTANYSAQPTTLEAATRNYGQAGDAVAPWAKNAGTTGTVATTDFVSFANNDFRPALASSPQVDGGVGYYGVLSRDIRDAEVPNYNNGGSEAVDAGCFEFDHGYGPHPASHSLTLSNVVVGSRVFIRDQANTTTHFDQIAASSTVTATVTVYGDSRDNWRIKVRNASGTPAYAPYETLMTATAGSSSIYVSQIPDE